MSSEKLKMGEVVQLKSGGPKMTVVGVVGSTGQIVCNWFDGNQVKSGTFWPEALKKVSEEQES